MSPPFTSRLSQSDASSQLVQLIAQIEQVDALGPEEREDEAALLLTSALSFIARVCGRELLETVYGSDPMGDDRRACLETLSERLWLLSQLFNFADPMHPSSPKSAALEANLVAGGDKPHLFAQLENTSGKRGNAFALAHLQLSALHWDALLGGFGISASERQSALSDAFGAPWDTIRKWKKPVTDAFGEDVVELNLAQAQRLGQGYADLGMAIDNAEIAQRGAAYRRLLGF